MTFTHIGSEVLLTGYLFKELSRKKLLMQERKTHVANSKNTISITFVPAYRILRKDGEFSTIETEDFNLQNTHDRMSSNKEGEES